PFYPCARGDAPRVGALGTSTMPKISTADGLNLYVETVGSGTPVVFVHEYAGDYRSWEPQVRYFCRQHRCVSYSQRGYPPSDVPSDPGRYSQEIARDDVIAVMDALGIDKAHVVGHSMGAYTALHVGIRYTRRCLSVTAAGCGWGSAPDAPTRQAMKDRKSTRLNSSHGSISYAVFCLKKKKKKTYIITCTTPT